MEFIHQGYGLLLQLLIGSLHLALASGIILSSVSNLGNCNIMKSEIVRCYGNMDWFRVAEQPPSFEALPVAFLEAKKLWSSSGEKQIGKVCELLSPFVGARFVAPNLDGWEEFLVQESFGEFEANRINVAGIDFSSEPIPLCKAEAWFDLPLKPGVDKSAFEMWAQNADLYSAVVFYWALDAEELQELDLTVGDHSGAEASIVS